MRAKPVNLNLFSIAFPVTAIASILHRISGILLFLLIPFALCWLQNSLVVSTIFYQVRHHHTPSMFTKILIWAALSALIYHLIAGLRHILMDVGLGEERDIARITSYVVLKLSFIISVMLGIYLLC